MIESSGVASRHKSYSSIILLDFESILKKTYFFSYGNDNRVLIIIPRCFVVIVTVLIRFGNKNQTEIHRSGPWTTYYIFTWIVMRRIVA